MMDSTARMQLEVPQGQQKKGRARSVAAGARSAAGRVASSQTSEDGLTLQLVRDLSPLSRKKTSLLSAKLVGG